MLRRAFVLAFLALVGQTQAQTFSRGAPASVVSPEADGRQHGIPAGATSPEPDGRLHGVPASIFSPVPFGATPIPSPFVATGHGPRRRFGTGKGHGDGRGHLLFVPVPLFYPIYPDAAYPVADPAVQAPEDPAGQAAANSDPAPAANNSSSMNSEEALRAAYLQGARDAMSQQQQTDPRYGGHYMDSRERAAAREAESRAARSRRQGDESTAPATQPKEDDSPATVFIFKDGSQVETRNFAIMGQTLYDFSGKQLKKIELADLDKAATTKANDDRGIQVKLP